MAQPSTTHSLDLDDLDLSGLIPEDRNLTDLARAALSDELDLHFHELPGGKFMFGLSADRINIHVRVTCREDADQVLVHAMSPINCPEGARAEFALKLHELNWKLVIGNFVMDCADGEFGYECTIDFEDLAPTIGAVSRLIRTAIFMLKSHWSELEPFLFETVHSAN